MSGRRKRRPKLAHQKRRVAVRVAKVDTPDAAGELLHVETHGRPQTWRDNLIDPPPNWGNEGKP